MKITVRTRLLLTVFSIVLSILTFPVRSAIYKTVDEHGNVIYSDAKPDDQSSEEVKLRPITRIESEPAVKSSSDYVLDKDEKQKEKSPSVKYSQLEIIDPANNGAVRNTGNFSVKVATTPKLRDGHKLRLLLDGNIVESARRTLNFTLLNVDRGVRVLTLQVLDGHGDVIQSSNSTVNVHRPIYKAPAPS